MAALYKSLCHIAAFHIKDIAITDEDVGILAYFDRTGFIGHTQNFSGIQRDGS